MRQLNHRGLIAVILAVALGLVLVILAIAGASGVVFQSEVGRSAAWALAGALAGALITFLTAAPSNGSKPPSKGNVE